jgi:hypothetical protein
VRADVSRAALVAIATLSSFALAGCGKKAPGEVAAVIDAQRETAIKVAENAAKACPAAKDRAPFAKNPSAAALPPPNPAKGTSLDTEPKIVDVFVMCSWPDPRQPSGEMWAGTALPSLRGTSQVPLITVTMPEDMVEDTCSKKPHDCAQVVTPSRFAKAQKSADFRIVRPTSDGGEAEVRIIIAID